MVKTTELHFFSAGSVNDIADTDGVPMCRSRGVYWTPENFQLETCALCYVYMPKNLFKRKWDATIAARVSLESGCYPIENICET